MHHLLECLGLTWYVLMFAYALPIPRHGVCKDLLGCGNKGVCMHDAKDGSNFHCACRSCPHVQTHTSAIMGSRTYTHERDHSHMRRHTQAQLCPHVHTHMSVIMPARAYTHELYHFHTRRHTQAQSGANFLLCVCVCVVLL